MVYGLYSSFNPMVVVTGQNFELLGVVTKGTRKRENSFESGKVWH